MKMPPQQPIVNGYYGYEDVPHIPENGQSLPNDGLPSVTPPEQVRQPSSNPADVFAEYMWMEHEEEFDKQVLKELEEEELMEQCLEAMLEEEHNNGSNRMNEGAPRNTQNREQNGQVSHLANSFRMVDVTKSTLNPLAAEFIPPARSTNTGLSNTE